MDQEEINPSSTTKSKSVTRRRLLGGASLAAGLAAASLVAKGEQESTSPGSIASVCPSSFR